MTAGSANEPAGREDLPDSVVSAKSLPLGSYNPVELDALASRPQRLLPVPERGHTEGVKKRMQNLAQYGGRSVQGQRAALANLRRRIVEPVPETPPELPANVPTPNVPATKLPTKTISQAKGRYLRSILSKEEYDLYLLTWREWFEAHPEYDLPEDVHDIETICMEAVIQYRINLLRQRFPSRDYSNEYNQSFRRAQQARENLAARRVDRLGPQGKGGRVSIGTMNVAVLAGQVDEKKLLEMKRSAQLQQAEDLGFLDRTRDNLKQLEFIDAAVVDAGEKEEERD